MAKGDELNKKPMTNNPFMPQMGQGLTSQPFGSGMQGGNILQSLMPFLAQMQQQQNQGMGQGMIQPGSPVNRAIKSAGAITNARKRLRGEGQ